MGKKPSAPTSWIQKYTLGYGLEVNRCIWCAATDYGGELTHFDGCMALIYDTPKDMREALPGGGKG